MPHRCLLVPPKARGRCHLGKWARCRQGQLRLYQLKHKRKMSTEFALDLKVARRKAGYTQNDLAHLLGSNQAHISELERGHILPTLEQIVTLSIIYGRSFEGLYANLLAKAREQLRMHIVGMPIGGRNYVGTFNRDRSIERLARRLAGEDKQDGEA